MVNQSQTYRDRFTSLNYLFVLSGGFSAYVIGIYCFIIAIHNIIVDAIFGIRGKIGYTVQTLKIAFVFSKKEFIGTFTATETGIAYFEVLDKPFNL